MARGGEVADVESVGGEREQREVGGSARCWDVRGRRWRGKVAEAEQRAMRRLLGEVEAVFGEVSSAERERRAAALWVRAVRGDFGTLLDERLAAMGEVETGRVRALLGDLVRAVAISLEEVMTDEQGDALGRSLAVSRLAQATGRVVGVRRRLATDQEEDAGAMLWRVLEELDAEQGMGDG